MAQVFVSYSRKDKDFAQKLVAALIADKREVWLDETNIEPTAEWLKEIFKNIEASRPGSRPRCHGVRVNSG
jgi:hypothetical protein